jgi:predicted ATPase
MSGRSRIRRLGEDAERVLSIAAVIGRHFDLELLARATKNTGKGKTKNVVTQSFTLTVTAA